MHPDYQKYNPFRSPQWRYDRVLELIEAQPHPQRCSRRRDDKYVREYRKFLLRYLARETEAERVELFPKNMGLYYAHQYHFYPDKEWRSLLQSRIVARCDDVTVAYYHCTLPEAVDWYEKLFFNVRDRLHAHDWIVKTVLGTAAHRVANREGSLTANQRDLCYKMFAYFGGPLVLEVVISGHRSVVVPKSQKQIAGWYDNTVRMLVRNKAGIAAQCFEVNKYNIMQLLEIHTAICSAEKEGGGPQTEVEKNIEAMMQIFPWSLGKRGLKELNEEQRRFALTAVEPRANQQLLLGSGEIPDPLLEAEKNVDMSRLIPARGLLESREG